MNWIKIILINLIVFFSLIGILFLIPPIYYYMSFSNLKQSERISEKPILYLYQDAKWVKKHFSELSKVTTEYYDYITWRSSDFIGDTINITDGLRSTSREKPVIDDMTQFLFFGGSTTWGTGVDDGNTYPSQFAKRFVAQVYNYGEIGYIARQSLAYLNNIFISHSMTDMSKIHVVFYDGVNDVAHRCRSDVEKLGSGREQQIQKFLSLINNEKYTFMKTFEQLSWFTQAILRRLGLKYRLQLSESAYNCSLNPDRAEEIARTLVETWQVASDLVEQRGGKFTAILQPVAFLGSPNVDYLDLTSAEHIALKKQYEVVYPLIRKLVLEKDISFFDFTDIFDTCDSCYIDFCHVGPQAHEILVKNLGDVLIK